MWVMSFDYGEARIGVAIGNTILQIPHPVETVIGRSKADRHMKISKLIDKWKPLQLVVGLPTNEDGKKDELVKSINRFANKLASDFKLPVIFINEDYTSSIAMHKLDEQSIRGLVQKAKLDVVAACVILQFFFDGLKK